MHPRRSQTVHTETLGDEVAVYDGTRQQVHALNATAARVWQLCDGATSPEAMAAALESELALPEAEAVVTLTLRRLARAHLLEVRGGLPTDRRGVTRRALLRRGVAASLLPVIHSIVAPSPAAAQSPPPGPDAPTLTNVSPDEGLPGQTVAVTLTGTNFIVGGTKVIVSGGGVTINNVVVNSSTSLTATFVLSSNGAATPGDRSVTVNTAGGTSNALTFTINAPESGSETFDTVGSHNFDVPSGVTTLTVTVRGAEGGGGGGGGVSGGQGGSVTALLTVVPGETLSVRVGGQGATGAAGGAGGFNGGGAGGDGPNAPGGGGGGASDIRRGGDALLVAGGGGGGAFVNAAAGAGGGTTGGNGGDSAFSGVTGGDGGTQSGGGSGGEHPSNDANDGENGASGIGGDGGDGSFSGGGGGGGGYYGGGGGGGANAGEFFCGAGGGGSSFADPGVASKVAHMQGGNTGDGEVLIEW